MPRFVLLYHECPPSLGRPSHWDLMLEDEGVLLTWALAAQPAGDLGEREIAAQRLADHRLAYLDYEGPVSGNRGHVRRIDAGVFTWEVRTPEQLRIKAAGKLLSGEASLVRVSDDAWVLSQ